jgi:hypothetical protein
VAATQREKETKAARLDMLERAVFPKIESLPIKQITSAHFLDVLKSATTESWSNCCCRGQATLIDHNTAFG